MAFGKVREKLGAVFALFLVFALLVGMSAVFGWNIPIITDIASALGLQDMVKESAQ